MKQIERELSREKEQFMKFDLKEKGLLDHLSVIEKDITEKRLVLNELRDKIRNNKKELQARQRKLAGLEKSLAEIEDLLSKRIVAFYKYAKRGYLQALSSSSGLDQLNNRIKYLTVILDEDRKIMKQAADEQLNYRREVSLVEEKLSVISSLEETENNRLQSLKGDLEKKVIFLSKIHREKEFYEIAVKELEAAAQNLKETLLNIDKEPKREKEASLPIDFASAKGKLPMPFKGDIIRKSRKQGVRTFRSQKGIYIKGDFGQEVRAVFPGRVDFSGQLKGYGQVIVINHGSRFFTISAYLLSRDKNEGEMVARGETIGQVGETGLLASPALYFEIRKGETPLDSLEWLKVN